MEDRRAKGRKGFGEGKLQPRRRKVRGEEKTVIACSRERSVRGVKSKVRSGKGRAG
jgi:hypothetical protein